MNKETRSLLKKFTRDDKAFKYGLRQAQHRKKDCLMIVDYGNETYRVEVKDGVIMDVIRQHTNDSDNHILSDYHMDMLETRITETARTYYMMKDNPMYTPIQVKKAREELGAAQDNAIARMRDSLGEYALYFINQATEKGKILALGGAE